MELTSNYLELVIKTVRGETPIPEYQGYKDDRTELAKKHLDSLKKKFKNKTTGSTLVDIVIRTGPAPLCRIWEKVSPASLTMCGEKSISNLIQALKTIEKENIPGDCIEAGAWRGGLPVIMRAFLQSTGNKKRVVWVADSFKGLPGNLTDPKDMAAHLLLEPLHYLSSGRKQVEKAFEFFGLNDDQVQYLEGWFKDSLKKMPQKPLALIRLDGDYYESTKDALIELYPKLSPGGFLIIDDYNLPLGCKRAVDEYRKANHIIEPMIKINKQAVYWRKQRS